MDLKLLFSYPYLVAACIRLKQHLTYIRDYFSQMVPPPGFVSVRSIKRYGKEGIFGYRTEMTNITLHC